MNRSSYRPWGPLPWVLRHIPKRQWSFLGCLGTEERSLGAWGLLRKHADINRQRLLRITDSPSHHSQLTSQRLAERQRDFLTAGGDDTTLTDCDLFCSHSEIVSIIDRALADSDGSFVIDITSLPKRFFFPMIRRLLADSQRTKLKDIIVTYSIPDHYPSGALAENFNDWAHLPLFGGGYSASPADMLVIGVGFEALGLHEHLKGEQGHPIKLLIPFPAPPPAFMRSWELLRQIRTYSDPDMFEVYRSSSKDPSDTFDRLVSFSRNGRDRIALAPFGPKPMSLGMCLFACISDCEALYTQPSVYHPDYSIGTSYLDGEAEVYGYCLRVGGREFYTLGP